MTFDQFLADKRAVLVERWRAKVAERPSGARARDAKASLAAFLEDCVKDFRADQPLQPEGESAAEQHGRAMREQGFSVEDVVHDYGDLRQAIVELAIECEAPASVADLGLLGRRLDNAVALAVGEFVSHQLAAMAEEHTEDMNHRLGVFAHALRNHVTTATLAVHISRTAKSGLTGASGQILDRSLKGLAQLVDRSLAEALLAHETVVEPEVFSLDGFIAEVQGSASLEADAAACCFIVTPVEPGLVLSADRDLLLSAVGSLLQNAFKYTRPGTEVRLKAYGKADRIRIDIEDNCGGLPAGGLERMFLPYGQRRWDQTRVGLGLSIAKRSVEANEGTLTVVDVPGCGCVFSIELPMHAAAGAVSSAPAGS